MSTLRKMRVTVGAAAVLAGAAWLSLAHPANASKFKVYSPIVEEGELGEIRNFTSPDRQDHRLGPAIFGKVDLIEGWGLKYEAAALFGLNDATPDVSYKGLIELEHHF